MCDFIHLPAEHHELNLQGQREHEFGENKSPEIKMAKSDERFRIAYDWFAHAGGNAIKK